MTDRFILISGCSGGGKSSLLDALGRRGIQTVPEPGRRIVAEELANNGDALPWKDLRAFSQRAVAMARADLAMAERLEGQVVFDRGLVDAAVAAEFAGGAPYRQVLGDVRHYADRVFIAPPWPEIFVADAEGRHGIEAATAEYSRLFQAFEDLGYAICMLPKVSVSERVDYVLSTLDVS